MLELYIANRKADIPENFSVLFNYNSTEVSNPTAIKNKYSSSIILPGTPENNAIFGDIWKLGRILIPEEEDLRGPGDIGRILSSVHFDPRKRVDFKIFNNSDLIESGYLQLLEINHTLDEISYRLSLYGGIGDFFYTLQYDQDNVEKNLASLFWGWKTTLGEEDTTSLGVWDRNFVIDSWSKLNASSVPGDIATDITAIPSYSGMYDEFSPSKVLINVPSLSSSFTESSNLFPSSVVNDNKTYSLYDSKYALLETPRELDEWEARDLRAEYQRVGVRFSSFFKAISNPENNGGYTVVLDDDIKNTPYYKKSWILLDRPKFDEISKEPLTQSTGSIHISDSQSEVSKDFMYTDSQISIFDTGTYVNPRLYVDVNVGIDFEYPDYSSEFDRFIPTAASCGNNYHNSNQAIWDSLGVRLEMYNPDTNALISNSDTFILRNNGMTVNGKMYGSIDDARDDIRDRIYQEIQTQVSSAYGGTTRPVRNYDYKRYRTSKTQSGSTIYDDYKSTKTLTLPWEDMPSNSRFKLRMRFFKIRVQASYSSQSQNASFWSWSTSIGSFNEWWDLLYQTSNDTFVRRSNAEIIAKDSYLEIVAAYFLDDSATEEIQARSITKDRIFSTSSNPLKYLLDWTKMFDLRFRTDPYRKIVYIDKRQNYYLNETENLTINLAKNIKIDPTVAKYKSFTYGLPIAETYMSKLYERKTTEPYGKVKLNTGYEFNNENRDLYEGSVYKALIPYAMNSYYFSHQGTGDIPSVALSPTYEYTLYKSGGTDEVYTQTLDKSWNSISSSYSTKFLDPVPKLCIFSDDDNYLDGVNSIVFFNGFYANTDIQVSDNIQAMFDLNEESCYLLSRDLSEVLVPSYIPDFFNSYISTSDPSVYSASFNFSAPKKESKNSELDYEYRAPIYYGFWDEYTQDLYNVNGKTIQVYAFVEGRPEDMMRKFWYYGDAVWVISEIKNYNITDSSVPVLMTLVKVDNPANYLIQH